MNLIKLVLINFSVLLALIIILFIPAEIYYSIKDSKLNSSENKMNYWLSVFPNTKDNSIYDLAPGEYRHIGPFNEFDYTFSINKYGYKEPNFNPKKSVDIVIYGDSFSFGHGVRSEESYSALISKRFPNLNIANLSYNGGFTSPHYLLHFLNNPNLKPQYIFVGTFLGNDCQSDMTLTKVISSEKGGYPNLLIEDGYLVGDQRNFSPNLIILKFLNDNSAFLKRVIQNIYASNLGGYIFNLEARPNKKNSQLFNSGGDIKSCDKNLKYIKNIEQQCMARNPSCKLVNLLIPERTNLHSGQKLMDNVINNCNKNYLECVDLGNVFQKNKMETYFKVDGHWNSNGHQIVSDIVSKKYIKN